MEPIDRLFDRFFVWVVASLASLEAIGQAADALLDERPEKVVLWTLLAIAMVLATRTLETIKMARDALNG